MAEPRRERVTRLLDTKRELPGNKEFQVVVEVALTDGDRPVQKEKNIAKALEILRAECVSIFMPHVNASCGRAPAGAERATEGERGLWQTASTDSAGTRTTTAARRGCLGRPGRVLAPTGPRGRAP
jgi:hypothetical protein